MGAHDNQSRLAHPSCNGFAPRVSRVRHRLRSPVRLALARGHTRAERGGVEVYAGKPRQQGDDRLGVHAHEVLVPSKLGKLDERNTRAGGTVWGTPEEEELLALEVPQRMLDAHRVH